MNNIKYCNVNGNKIAYCMIGTGKVDVVIEAGLLSCMAEWNDTAKLIAKDHTVLLYERAGIFHSEQSRLDRTPENVANDLYEVLKQIPHEDKVILIGHSQGGLYVQQFARKYPSIVKGVILLDPLSGSDNQFKELLTKEEYKAGGIDKFSNLDLSIKMLRLHLGGILKKVMKKAPPLSYYDFNEEDRNEILDSFVCIQSFNTAKKEYELSHQDQFINHLKNKDNFPDIPLVLITHSNQYMIQETMYFGRTSYEIAEKVENVWQQIMKQYLEFTPNSIYLQAKNSGHYMHLTEPELIMEAYQYIDNFNETI